VFCANNIGIHLDELKFLRARLISLPIILEDWPLRIAFVYPRLAIGGIETNILNTSRLLCQYGCDCFIATLTGVYAADDIKLDINNNYSEDFFKQFKAIPRTIAQLRDLNLDIVHVHSYWIHPFTNVEGLLAHKIAKRLVITPHLHMASRQSIINRERLLRRLILNLYHHYVGIAFYLRRADAVIALSNKEADLYKSWGISPVTVIPNGVNLPSVRIKRNFGDHPKQILCVSRIEPNKGIEFLIKAAQLINKQNISFKLNIAGPFNNSLYLNLLYRLIKNYDLDDNVKILGLVDNLEELYNEAHVFVLPSLYEAQPIRVLEAISHGLPIVATNVGDVPSMVNQKNGIIVRPRKPEDLALGIIRILRNSFAAEDMEKENYAMSLSFSWENATKKLAKVYDTLIGRPAN
jgi:glycosyltransferase involved in cell wall biosynthesis